LNETTTGLIGEYIAAAAILGLGWRVSMAQQDRVDMVAWYGQDFIRVQAKTASLLGNSDRRSPRHHFQLGHGCKTKKLPTQDDYDVLCLVSPDARRVLFMPVTSVRQYTLRLQPSRFTLEAESDSWDKAVEIVMETRR
jgi:hypothetical protein|tara:strand:- start:534 stop:947 length:414 start_codon:yes stop_codon:yes gene_type:complete